ncbi:hypothetical protein M569_08359, partial [Genlisea aurea]
TWVAVISLIGFLSFLNSSISLLKWVFANFLRKPKDLLKTYGSWAVVTGATDGIGKAFAFKLAALGFNLVLVSRDAAKLTAVSSQISHDHPRVRIISFQIDLSADDAASKVAAMGRRIENLDVGVLINNAGVTYPKATHFHELDEGEWMKIVRVNVVGTSYVTGAVIPNMVAKKTGAVVNIGSGASVVVPSHPLYAVYAATKAYVDELSRSLHVEYKGYGVSVQCQVPLYVCTKMASRVAAIEEPSVFVLTPRDYVEAAVRFIGHEPRCSPYWAHSVQWFFASLLPEYVLDTWRYSIGLRRAKQL